MCAESCEPQEIGFDQQTEEDTVAISSDRKILKKIHQHCESISESNIRNVLLFFYDAEKSKFPVKTNNLFKLIPIDYSREIKGNFIAI